MSKSVIIITKGDSHLQVHTYEAKNLKLVEEQKDVGAPAAEKKEKRAAAEPQVQRQVKKARTLEEMLMGNSDAALFEDDELER